MKERVVEFAKRRPIWSPHVFISAADQIPLKPSWQRWLAAGGNSNQQQESFYLRAQTQANTENIAQIKQIAQVKLQLQA